MSDPFAPLTMREMELVVSAAVKYDEVIKRAVLNSRDDDEKIRLTNIAKVSAQARKMINERPPSLSEEDGLKGAALMINDAATQSGLIQAYRKGFEDGQAAWPAQLMDALRDLTKAVAGHESWRGYPDPMQIAYDKAKKLLIDEGEW